jgi:GT2 family glycosyltransferase
MDEPINTFVFCPIVPDYMERALATLYKFTPPNFRVVVVDQTLTGIDFLAHDARVHLYVRPYRNLGFASAMNLGMRIACTKYVTAANDDIEFINDKWWAGIVETFKNDPSIKAVNPMSIAEPGWGYGCNKGTPPDIFEPKEEALKAKFNPETGNFEHLPYQKDYSEDDWQKLIHQKSGCIDGIITWMTVFEKEALEYKGYYDERFTPGGGEDYDLGARFYCKNWPTEGSPRYRVVATSKSWCWHWLGSSRSYKGEILKTGRPGFGRDHFMWEDNWYHPTMALRRIDSVQRFPL